MTFHVYRSGIFRREWRWRLRARNGRIVADSGEGYTNKDDCLSIIERIREAMGEATVRVNEGRT